jgi:hypothetical protein
MVSGNDLLTCKEKVPLSLVNVPSSELFTVMETAGTGSPVFSFFTDPLMILCCANTIVERKFNTKNNMHCFTVFIKQSFNLNNYSTN